MGRGERPESHPGAARSDQDGREAQRKDSQPLREKMRTARRQLQQAMRADVPDEAAIRSAAGAVAALQADQAVQRARARTQFMSVLTPEQQARMKQARARAAQRAQRAQRAMRQLQRSRGRCGASSSCARTRFAGGAAGSEPCGERAYAARFPFRTTHQMREARTRRASRPLTANSISVE